MKKQLFFIAGLFSCTFASAQNWTGAVNADWNNAANWSQTPSNGSDIEIDPANYTGAMAQPVISTNSNFAPGEMLIQNGGKLTVSANLSATDRCEILGAGSEVTITNGTFAVNGSGNNARIIFAEGSLLTMNSGTFTVGQRLLFELGGSGVINGGTVTVAQTLGIVDGSATAPSRLLLNGGTLVANGEFGFENEAGNFFPSFTQTGGMLNIVGDLVWLGAAPGSGRGSFNVLGGTTTVTGTILNDPASTMNMTLRVSGQDALFNMTGTSISQLAGDSIIIANDAEFVNVNNLAWNNNGIVHCFNNGLFTTGNTTLTGTGSYQFFDVHVPASKSLVHLQPAQIAVAGDFSSTGNFVHNTNKLLFNGNTSQFIAFTNSNLYDVEFNNSQSAQAYAFGIIDNVNVSHDLKLTDGLIVIQDGQFNIGQNATITGGSAEAFVDGYIQKTGNSAVTLPLGKSPDIYRPLSLNGITSANTVIKAAYKNEAFSALTPVEAPLQAVSAIEYWDLSRTGSIDLFTATAGWNNASQSGLSNCDDITLSVRNNNEWKFVPSSTLGLCGGNNPGSLSSAANLPAIGALTIGFTSNVFQQIVTICHTDSLVVGDTAYYEPGVYIDVLAGSDGDSTVVSVLHVVQPLNLQLGNLDTNLYVIPADAAAYQWIDCNNNFAEIPGATTSQFSPTENGSYAVVVYQQYCTVGDTSECGIISILDIKENAVFDFKLFPNPVNGAGSFTVKSADIITEIQIFSTEGKQISTLIPEMKQSEVEVNLAGFSAGTYTVKVRSGNGSAVRRFVVN